MQYRKFTRIKNYDYNTNGYYFVTICTAARKPWLEIYKTAVETILKDIPKRFTGINIDFYSIMPDHLRVIFTLNNANAALGEAVRTFKALVTKSTGRKPFWEWNYYEHIIRDEKALYNIRRYILENPLKEKINWEKIYSGINAAATNETKHSADNPQPCSADKGVQQIPPNRSGAIYRTNKGISLIIAVFAIMLFSVLGWTLVKIQSTDFESNVSTGNLNSERALNLAEAGAEWALQRLNLNGGFRTDTTNGYPLGYAQHSISPGQYRVSCLDGTGDDYGLAIITSNGYIPSTASYNTARQVRLKIQVGSLTSALQTQVPDVLQPTQGLFDWSLTRSGHASYYVEGNILAGHYNADGAVGEAPYDELNDDYSPPPAAPLPPDNSPQNYQRGFSAAYPSINMKYFYDLYEGSGSIWPDPSDRQITAVATITTSGNNQYLVVDINNFFNGMNNHAARRTNPLNWWQGDGGPDSDWKSINGVSSSGRPNNRARISTNPADWVNWPDEDLTSPLTIQVSIKIVKRFYDNSNGNDYNNERWYIGGEIADPPDNGISAETIIDLRGGEVRFRNVSIISEGDIIIKGGDRIQMQFSGGSSAIRYPVLATKSGNIISGITIDGAIIASDTPSGGDENERMNQRRISGLIYSESGNVSFNYLVPTDPGPTGNLVYGKGVTLDGRVRIVYSSSVFNSGGFVFAPATKSWDEE